MLELLRTLYHLENKLTLSVSNPSHRILDTLKDWTISVLWNSQIIMITYTETNSYVDIKIAIYQYIII